MPRPAFTAFFHPYARDVIAASSDGSEPEYMGVSCGAKRCRRDHTFHCGKCEASGRHPARRTISTATSA